VRAAGERFAPGFAAAAACFCALLFGGGSNDDPLVWVGGLALAAAALVGAAAFLGALPAPRLDGPAALFLGCLLGLAVWIGASTWWSISPDRSWGYTNRTLVYVAFAVLGLLLSALLPRAASTLAGAAAVLLGLVIGWALIVKCVPGLYADYGRIARLRAPLDYWNELALVCVVAVPVALWVAAPRARRAGVRAAGVALLFASIVALLLTYSRFGVVLGCVVAAGWVLLERDRVESIAALRLAGGAGAAVFGVALALPGISEDGQPRSVRAHDGWIFALVLLAAGAAVFAAAHALARLEERRPLGADRRRRVERAVGVAALALAVAGLAVAIVFAGRIWTEFTNPVSAQISSHSTRFLSVNSSNRWRWWGDAWQTFLDHPLGGTGAGTFELISQRLRTSSLILTTEPHNVPLQFLSETGIVGFLLYLGAAAAAVVGIVRARRRAAGAERAAVTALAVALAAFLVHTVADMDWNFVGTCGPLLLLAGALLGRPAAERVRARRPLVAAAAVLLAAAAVYSLAAPWLARRELAAVRPQKAHSYDPLNTQALIDWAAMEDARGNVLHAATLYNDAVALEPESYDTWYALGLFYADHGAWQRAYEAFGKSWTYNRFGPAGEPCGMLDQARHKATGRWAPNCPGGRRAASPSGGSG
jgi:hypothetical protein